MKGMRRMLAIALLAGVCLIPAACRDSRPGGAVLTPESTGRNAEARPEGTCRALVIGCDRFVSMPDTTPCSANNAEIMEGILTGFVPGTAVEKRVNGPATSEELAGLIRETFRDAVEGDISYVYISTHGVIWEEDGETCLALLLSDGENEEALTPEVLRRMLDEIPGDKAVILDACHSGAAVPVFSAPGYRILTSSGAEEDSYFWTADGADGNTGTGYFTSALDSALRDSEPFQLDPDGDGRLTAAEVLGRLKQIYGASGAEGYPADGDAFLFGMPEERLVRHRVRALEFDPVIPEEDTVIQPLRFSVPEPLRIEYRMIPKKDGEWDFTSATTLPDRERSGAGRGMLAPGEKNRKIRVPVESLGADGEVLLQIISLHDGVPVQEGTRVIRRP